MASGRVWTIAERAGGCQRLSSLGVGWPEWAGMGGVANGGGLFRLFRDFAVERQSCKCRSGLENRAFWRYIFTFFPKRRKLSHTRALAQTRTRARVPARLRAPLHVRPPSQGQNCQVLNIVELSGEKWVPRVGRERQSVIGRPNRPTRAQTPCRLLRPSVGCGATADCKSTVAR